MVQVEPELNYRLREEIFPLFLELKDKKKGTEYLEVLIKYLTRSARSLPEKELNEAVTQLFEEGGDLMETIAEQWKKEERLETAKRMLLDNISIEKVIKYTGLTEKEVKALMN